MPSFYRFIKLLKIVCQPFITFSTAKIHWSIKLLSLLGEIISTNFTPNCSVMHCTTNCYDLEVVCATS